MPEASPGVWLGGAQNKISMTSKTIGKISELAAAGDEHGSPVEPPAQPHSALRRVDSSATAYREPHALILYESHFNNLVI